MGPYFMCPKPASGKQTGRNSEKAPIDSVPEPTRSLLQEHLLNEKLQRERESLPAAVEANAVEDTAKNRVGAGDAKGAAAVAVEATDAGAVEVCFLIGQSVRGFAVLKKSSFDNVRCVVQKVNKNTVRVVMSEGDAKGEVHHYKPENLKPDVANVQLDQKSDVEAKALACDQSEVEAKALACDLFGDASLAV
jgi:hypothetical protein